MSEPEEHPLVGQKALAYVDQESAWLRDQVRLLAKEGTLVGHATGMQRMGMEFGNLLQHSPIPPPVNIQLPLAHFIYRVAALRLFEEVIKQRNEAFEEGGPT